MSNLSQLGTFLKSRGYIGVNAETKHLFLKSLSHFNELCQQGRSALKNLIVLTLSVHTGVYFLVGSTVAKENIQR